MFNILITFILLYLSRLTTKPTKWHVRPAKTQINLGIRPFWSESSLSTWVNLRSLAIIRAHSEASDQTGRMPRLIWVFAGRKDYFVGFVMRRCVLCVEGKSEWKNSIRCQTYAKTEDHIELKLYFNSRHPQHRFSAQQNMQHLRISWRNPCIWRLDFCQIINSCSCFRMDHKSKQVYS